MAHEIRNLLQTIVTSAHGARRRAGDTADPALARIERAGEKSQRIVDTLLDLAAGRPLTREPTPVRTLLELAREDWIGASVAEFDDRIHAVESLSVEPETFARALRAIYDNAIAASTGRAPTIVTEVSRSGPRVTIEIHDDGPGIPEAVATTLFEPLVTASAGGTGLGLAMARRVILAHGASLELADRSSARFRMVLAE